MNSDTTSNKAFYSKSNGAGTTRWLVDDPNVERAYVMDLAVMGLAHRWYVVALQKNDAGEFQFRVAGLGLSPEITLGANVIEALSKPVISSSLNVSDRETAAERFERVSSNVMHGMLAPLPEVAFIWNRFATTDGVGAYSPQ